MTKLTPKQEFMSLFKPLYVDTTKLWYLKVEGYEVIIGPYETKEEAEAIINE